MKKLMFAAAIIGTTFISSAASASNYIELTGNKDFNKICEAIQSNDKKKLFWAIKDSSLDYRSVVKSLSCNGQSALTFAMTNGANDIAKVMAKRTNIDLKEMLAKR